MNNIVNRYWEYLLATAVLLLVLIILFNKPVTGNYTFAAADTLSPSAIAQGIDLAQEKDGEYPLWLPWVFSGLPSVHSFQNISKYYLPNYLLFMFIKSGMPLFITTILHFILAGLGVYVLLRKLGNSIYSALFGGLSFIMMPYLVAMIVHGHGSQMMTAAYIPWIFWCLLRLKEKPDLARTGLLALFAGLQLQRGHVQIAYYTWLMVGLFLLIELVVVIKNKEQQNLHFFGYAFIALLLAVGMSMIIYMPVASYTNYSIRGGSSGGAGFNYATQWSFSFKELLTFLVPSSLGFGGVTYWGNMPFTDYPNYMGIIVLLFAVYGTVTVKSSVRWTLILTALIALLLSFGKNLFLYQLFYDYLPYFNQFRVPAMFLVLTQFSTAVLAGIGLESLFKRISKEKSRKWILYILCSAVSIFIITFLFSSAIAGMFGIPLSQYPVINKLRVDMLSTDLIIMSIFILLAVVTLFATYRKWLKIGYAVLMILLLSVIDLAIVDFKIIEPSKVSLRSQTLQKFGIQKSYLRTDEVINFIENDRSDFRILPMGQLMNENRWSAFQIESVMGYHPAKLNNYNQLINNVGMGSIGILRMLNVKYVLSPELINHPALEEVFKGKLYHNGNYINCWVYRFKDFLPRAFYVHELRSIPETKDQITLLKQPTFDPLFDSFTDVKYPTETYFPNNSSTPEILSRTANEIKIATNLSSDQFMVISEIFYPNGWKVSIDGAETEIYQVNTVLRGLKVPAGKHNIVMRFAPKDLKYGSILSWSSVLIILILLATGINRRK